MPAYVQKGHGVKALLAESQGLHPGKLGHREISGNRGPSLWATQVRLPPTWEPQSSLAPFHLTSFIDHFQLYIYNYNTVYNFHQVTNFAAVVSSSQVCLGMVAFGAFCTAENSAPGTACDARGSAGDAGGALSPTRKHPSAAWFGTVWVCPKWQNGQCGVMLVKQ